MKHPSVCLLFALSIQSFCYADVTKFATANPSDGGLSAEARRVLQDSSRFHEVHSTSDLPPAIVGLCTGGKAGLAEPGQRWNPTDVVVDPTLPSKRLIWAAVGHEYYVVHYERGGIAHTYHILVATLAKDDAKAKVVWRAVGTPLKDYAAFLDALRTGKLHDSLDYAHRAAPRSTAILAVWLAGILPAIVCAGSDRQDARRPPQAGSLCSVAIEVRKVDRLLLKAM